MIPSMETLLVFIITSTIACLIPGPAVIYAILQTTSKGFKCGMDAVWGLQVGFFLQVLAAACGLSVLILKSTVIFGFLKIIGAAYLIYLGLSFVITKDSGEDMSTLSHQKKITPFTKGILINILNPKIAIFFISYLPQFVDEASRTPIAQIFLLGILFSLLGTAVCIFYILLASKASNKLQFFFKSSLFKRWLPGSIFIGFGVRLVFSNE
ncbi:MAG: LysE family translocator [Desulfobacula sp.]|nr:LysE family translocator [Desulfobacula sp.]